MKTRLWKQIFCVLSATSLLVGRSFALDDSENLVIQDVDDVDHDSSTTIDHPAPSIHARFEIFPLSKPTHLSTSTSKPTRATPSPSGGIPSSLPSTVSIQTLPVNVSICLTGSNGAVSEIGIFPEACVTSNAAQRWVWNFATEQICTYAWSQPWCWLWDTNPAGTFVGLVSVLAGAPPSPNQVWSYNGAIQPVTGGSLIYCVQPSPYTGNQVEIVDCDGSASQQWAVVAHGVQKRGEGLQKRQSASASAPSYSYQPSPSVTPSATVLPSTTSAGVSESAAFLTYRPPIFTFKRPTPPPIPTGLVLIKSAVDESKCLVAWGSDLYSILVRIEDCTALYANRWTYVPDPGPNTIILFNQDPSLCWTNFAQGGQVFANPCTTTYGGIYQTFTYNSWTQQFSTLDPDLGGWCVEVTSNQVVDDNPIVTQPCDTSNLAQQWVLVPTPPFND